MPSYRPFATASETRPVPRRHCYDVATAFVAVGILTASFGWAVTASEPSTPRSVVGIVCLVAAILVALRALRNLREGLRESLLSSSLLVNEEPPSFGTAEAAMEHLLRLHREIAARMDRQQSEQSRILRDLGTSTLLLQTAYAALTDAVLVLDNAGRIVLLNPAAGTLLGLGDEHLQRPLVEVLRAPDLLDVVAASQSARQTTTLQVEFKRAGRITFVVASPLPEDPGGTVVLIRDETELRKLERMRRDFVSNVSHELKTPLTSIQAYAETLLDGGSDEPEVTQRFLSRIVEQSERLGEMIVDMLDLSRLETSDTDKTPEPVDTGVVIQDCVDLHAFVADTKKVSLSVDLDDAIPVLADEASVRMILDNLVKNAIEHTPTGGSVTITADEQIPEVASEQWTGPAGCFHITDTGAGIPRDAQDRIFERFFRVDASRNRQLGGSGLGLAIVKNAAERYGGKVYVESILGQGSTFHVLLQPAHNSNDSDGA